MSPEEYKVYYEKVYAQQGALSRLGLATGSSGEASASSASSSVGKKRALEDGDSTAADWQMHKDPSSGAMYYFNSTTGESTWTTPDALTVKK
jgi:hypothetical protein